MIPESTALSMGTFALCSSHTVGRIAGLIPMGKCDPEAILGVPVVQSRSVPIGVVQFVSVDALSRRSSICELDFRKAWERNCDEQDG